MARNGASEQTCAQRARTTLGWYGRRACKRISLRKEDASRLDAFGSSAFTATPFGAYAVAHFGAMLSSNTCVRNTLAKLPCPSSSFLSSPNSRSARSKGSSDVSPFSRLRAFLPFVASSSPSTSLVVGCRRCVPFVS